MSTLTTHPTARPSSALPGRPHLSFLHLVHAEWIKLWTVRATLWTVPLTVATVVGINALAAWGTATAIANADPSASGEIDITSVVLGGVFFGQLAIVVLAILSITGEYSTGMIRATLTAVPARLPVLWAKVLVLAVVVFGVGIVSSALTYVVTAPILGSALKIDLGDSESLRVLVGVPLYLVAIAVFSFAIGALLRFSAAAMATVLGLLLVVESVFQFIPFAFFRNVSPFLPSTAGQRVMQTAETIELVNAAPGPDLSVWQGYGVLWAWAVLLLVVAAVLLRRRDA